LCKEISSFFWQTELNLNNHPTPREIEAENRISKPLNLHPMVQTEVSQLSAECQEWRQILRNYREELQTSKKALQETCTKTLSKSQLLEVEHFDNQFHIQLINIHDLKQSIKSHERKIEIESSSGDIGEDTYSLHEELLNEFLGLENTLQELRNEFKNFISATSC
jgi:hypothetical protein